MGGLSSAFDLENILPSATRHSELQAFKPKGHGLHYTLPSSLCDKIRDLTKSMTRDTSVPTGKPDFGGPNCLVRALRYYDTCRVSRVEEGQTLLVYSRYTKVGKELSAVSISHWICNTIPDSHATL